MTKCKLINVYTDGAKNFRANYGGLNAGLSKKDVEEVGKRLAGLSEDKLAEVIRVETEVVGPNDVPISGPDAELTEEEKAKTEAALKLAE